MKKKETALVTMLVLTLVSGSLVWASTTYSDPGTFDVEPRTDWNEVTTLGIVLGNEKTTSSLTVTEYTLAKTMTSHPNFRIVNSEGYARSAVFKVASPGREETSDSGTGEIGYAYFASVKPDWAQTRTHQSIRLQFKVD